MPPDTIPSPGLAGSSAAPIRIQTNPSPEIWESYVRAQPDASFFHGTAWQRVLERTFDCYRPCHRVAWRGDSVCGVLPLYQVPSLPFGCALISTPLGLYGGVCADDDDAARALLDDTAAFARKIGARYVELRHERPVGSLQTKDLYVAFHSTVHADRDAAMVEIPRPKRRRIHTAEKQGLTFRTGGVELLPQFYDVYSENMRDLGSPAFPRQLFEALLEEYGTECRIFAVFQGDTMHSGSLGYFYRDRIISHYGASTHAGMKASANEFMFWNIMCHAAERGLRMVDFGRSKKDSGSYHFKRHWGFTPIPLPYQYQLVGQREMPNLSPSNPKYALVIQTWRRMPLRFTRWLGPKLSRYFP